MSKQVTLDGKKYDPEPELEKYFKSAILAEIKETKTTCKVTLYYIGENNMATMKADINLRISKEDFLERWKNYQKELLEDV